MADRRSARSASRRMTPTPQPPSTGNTPAEPAARRRGTRSQSREVEQQPTRRSVRQASVASESDRESTTGRQSKRKQKQAVVPDLSIVEEAPTEIIEPEHPRTPDGNHEAPIVPNPSPGVLSQMSGTTAISSFSQAAAEDLDPKFLRRHIGRLYSTSETFLAHLAPDKGRIEDDEANYMELRKPDSDYSTDFRDFDADFKLRFNHFRKEPHQYINVRAVRRALLGLDRDPTSIRAAIDLFLYKANLLVLARELVGSEREHKLVWDALRQLDDSFPTLFLSAFVPVDNAADMPNGESTLLKETFDMALEIRTQLTVLAFENAEEPVEADEKLAEIFLESVEGGNAVLRGWDIAGLGGAGLELPSKFRTKVIERMEQIRRWFPGEHERGETMDLEGLAADFSWKAFVLQLLHWVRLRNRELESSIIQEGGSSAIEELLARELDNPHSAIEPAPAARQEAHSNRLGKSRNSWDSARRRSSGRYKRGEPIGAATLDLLREIAQQPTPQPRAESSRQAQERADEPVQGLEQNIQDEIQNDAGQPPEDAAQPQGDGAGLTEELVEAEPISSVIPGSSHEMLVALSQSAKTNKENHNRRGRIFDAQPNAQSVEFGDGFDSQPAVASSSSNNQPQRRTPRKRAQNFEDSDEDDAFETAQRSATVKERREQAPTRKKLKRAHFAPTVTSPRSSAPPSHQPERHRTMVRVPELDDSISEGEAPDMTEEAPPASSFADIKDMARQHTRAFESSARQRKDRTLYSAQEEEAIIEYMRDYPQKYAAILRHDADEGYGVLQDRTQVNLKDKVVNMAVNMIKSGTGLRPGFENVISRQSKKGRALLEANYDW